MKNNITVNTNVGGFRGKNMVILKVMIFKNTERNRYLTLFSLVPDEEVFNRNDTSSFISCGVFFHFIGSAVGLIRSTSRVSLSTYEKHLRDNGWIYLQTIPGSFGGEYETVRKIAYKTIKNIVNKA